MSVIGNIDRILNALPEEVRRPIQAAFEYVMRENALGDNTKADNFTWFRITGTTAAAAGTEFSIAHGLDHIPDKLIPVLRLDSTGVQMVPLNVSRVADAQRIYLTSASTSATFTAYLE